MSERAISELFYNVMMWAKESGAPIPLNSVPGCWHGTREFDGDKIKVTINGHSEQCEELDPFTVKLESTKYLALAILNPYGGITGGAHEDEWIKAFPREPT